MGKTQSLQGASLSGGKRRRTRKRRVKRNKGGGVGLIGNQKPYSQDNPPKPGDKVRVKLLGRDPDDPRTWDPNWTVDVVFDDEAEVCPPYAEGFTFHTEDGPKFECTNSKKFKFSDMQRHGFVGNVLGVSKSYKKRGGKSRKAKKSKKSRKHKKGGVMPGRRRSYMPSFGGPSRGQRSVNKFYEMQRQRQMQQQALLNKFMGGKSRKAKKSKKSRKHKKGGVMPGRRRSYMPSFGGPSRGQRSVNKFYEMQRQRQMQQQALLNKFL